MGAEGAVTRMPAWRRCLQAQGVVRAPDELVGRLDAGEPIALGGRCSSSDGAQGRRQAVDDLYGAAKELALATGIDVRGFLPTKDDLQSRLSAASAHTSTTIDGTTFRNRYMLVDERERAGVIFIVSVGSGHLLDDQGEQPFVRYVAQTVRRYGAAVFACKRLDRGAREDWGAAPLMIALRQREGYLFDEDGLGPIDQARSMVSFIKGGGSRKVADDMPHQTRAGQRELSGTQLIDGQARYHISSKSPPGFGTAWLRNGTTPTERVVYLDCDDARPRDVQVAYGLPEVYEDGIDGPARRVDQVANVRFLLSVLGRPSWTHKRLVAELSRRKFSTPGLRALHGPDAAMPNNPASGRLVVETVVANLEVYETGVLRRELGADVEPLEITDCWPLDGEPWAQPEDFERIRTYRRDRDARTAKMTQLTFAGLRATYDGTSVRMVTGRAPRRSPNGPRPYQFVFESAYPHKQLKPAPHVPLPWQAFAESLVDSIASTGQVPAEIASELDLEHGADDGLSEQLAEEAECRREIDALEQRLARLEARLEEVDEHGEFVLSGALLQRVQAEYNEIHEQKLPQLRRRRDELTQEIEQRRSKRPDHVAADAVLWLVESLRDPGDRSFRHLWLSSLHNVKFHTEAFTRHSAHGTRLTWTGALRLGHDDHTFVLPFHGSHETGAAANVENRRYAHAGRIIEAMAAGTPYPHTSSPARIVRPHVVAQRLGADPERFLLSACDDPRITRIAVACYQRRAETVEAIADSLAVEPALVRRVRAIHLDDCDVTQWRGRCARAEVAFYAVAAATHGRVTAAQILELIGGSRGQVYNLASRLTRTSLWSSERKRGYLLRACNCGSASRAPMRIPEPDGPVCLGCRRDLAGIHWPAHPYDAHIAHPDLWRSAGWRFDEPPENQP